MPFDQVLRLTPRAIDSFIEMPCPSASDVGDNVADIGAFSCHLDTGHDPAGARPGLRGVACHGEVAHLLRLDEGAANATFVEFRKYLSRQNLVGPETEDVSDVIAFAPVHHLLAPVM